MARLSPQKGLLHTYHMPFRFLTHFFSHSAQCHCLTTVTIYFYNIINETQVNSHMQQTIRQNIACRSVPTSHDALVNCVSPVLPKLSRVLSQVLSFCLKLLPSLTGRTGHQRGKADAPFSENIYLANHHTVDTRLRIITQWTQEIITRWTKEIIKRWTQEFVIQWEQEIITRWTPEIITQWTQEIITLWTQEIITRWTQEIIT